MPRRGGRGRGGDGGDPPEGRPPRRPGGHGGGAGSMREAEDTTAEVARAGRSGAGGAQTDDYVTSMTGRPGGTPDGHPTRIKPVQKPDVRRSLELENSAATVLADKGYRLKQNPTPDEVAQARVLTGDIGKPTSKRITSSKAASSTATPR